MIQNDIRIYMKSGLVACMDRRVVFIFRTVFCPDRSFLVELAEIIYIVDTVAYVIYAIHGFICRRHPDGCEPHGFQCGCIFCQLIPERSVGRQIPLEILQHRSVPRKGIVVCHQDIRSRMAVTFTVHLIVDIRDGIQNIQVQIPVLGIFLRCLEVCKHMTYGQRLIGRRIDRVFHRQQGACTALQLLLQHADQRLPVEVDLSAVCEGFGQTAHNTCGSDLHRHLHLLAGRVLSDIGDLISQILKDRDHVLADTPFAADQNRQRAVFSICQTSGDRCIDCADISFCSSFRYADSEFRTLGGHIDDNTVFRSGLADSSFIEIEFFHITWICYF